MVASKFAKLLNKLLQLGIAKNVTWTERIKVGLIPETNEPSYTWGSGGSILALVRRTRVGEFFSGDLKGEEEKMRIYTATQISYLDHIQIGSKIYEVGPVEDRNKVGCYVAVLTKLIIVYSYPTDEEFEEGSESFPLGSYFYEPWNFGSPSIFPLLHDEGWNYPDVPSLTLLHSEAWSS